MRSPRLSRSTASCPMRFVAAIIAAIGRNHHVVEQQHHQAAFGRSRDVIRLHIGGNGSHPAVHWQEPAGRRHVNRHEVVHRSRLTVLQNREVGARQSTNRRAVPVEHRHVQMDEIDGRSKLRRLRQDDRGQRGQEQKHNAAHGVSVECSLRRLQGAAMTLTEAFRAELDREGPRTRRALEQVPLDHDNWAPHQKSMPLGRLAGMVASMPSWVA